MVPLHFYIVFGYKFMLPWIRAVSKSILYRIASLAPWQWHSPGGQGLPVGNYDKSHEQRVFFLLFSGWGWGGSLCNSERKTHKGSRLLTKVYDNSQGVSTWFLIGWGVTFPTIIRWFKTSMHLRDIRLNKFIQLNFRDAISTFWYWNLAWNIAQMIPQNAKER